MSVSGNEIADAEDNAVRNSDCEDDGFGNRRRKKKRSYYGFAGKFRRAKQVLLCSSFPGKSNQRRAISLSDKSVAGNQRCGFCISRPKTLESPVESHTSDPNDPTFIHEMVRALLEKNDFYCKDCNPHLDVDDLPS